MSFVMALAQKPRVGMFGRHASIKPLNSCPVAFSLKDLSIFVGP